MPSSACDWSSDVCSSDRSEEHTSELQSRSDLVCRLLLEKKKKNVTAEARGRHTRQAGPHGAGAGRRPGQGGTPGPRCLTCDSAAVTISLLTLSFARHERR